MLRQNSDSLASQTTFARSNSKMPPISALGSAASFDSLKLALDEVTPESSQACRQLILKGEYGP